MEQFSRQLAKELGPQGISINTVAPGPINTELFTAGKSQEEITRVGSMNSFGRLPRPRISRKSCFSWPARTPD